MGTSAPLSLDEFVGRVMEAIDAVEPAAASYDSPFAEVGLDSMQVLQLVLVVEELADCGARPAEAPDLGTLADAYRHYRSLLEGAPVPHVSPRPRGQP
jgi:acyl carrier protein